MYNGLRMQDQPLSDKWPVDASVEGSSSATSSSSQPPLDSQEIVTDAEANPSAKRFFLDALETIAVALIIFFVIYNFVAQPHLVKGESMQPNYFEGEYILTSKLYNWMGTPERGDVIILKSPDDQDVQFIKRIIALPGEKIRLQDNQLYIYNQDNPDGFALNEEYLRDDLAIPDGSFLPEGSTIDVPEEQYVVMGDNRPASYDSRNWGTVPKENIVGKAFFIYWPVTHFGFVGHAEY